MTVPGGSLDLTFRHNGAIRDLELPNPETVKKIFLKGGVAWNDWAKEKLSAIQRDHILESALFEGVVSQRLLERHREELEPTLTNELTFWGYFNNFTRVLTHEVTKIQPTKKLNRLDRISAIFDRVLSGLPDPSFSDEEN